MSAAANKSEKPAENGLSASVQVLDLNEGVYYFSVRTASPMPMVGAGNMTLPAVHVGLGPGTAQNQVEFLPGPRTHGNWLFSAGDSLIAKINAPSVGIVLTSLRAPGGENLAIEVERMGTGDGVRLLTTEGGGAAAPEAEPDEPPIPSLPIQLTVHIRNRGDVTFNDFGWAGRVGNGLWLEAFSVTPLESLTPGDVEYKALTATGVETPWVGNGAACGTRGLGVPLIGFAVRLKQEANSLYECRYSGAFQSGAIIGPISNGQPCRSARLNDPLEGIRIQIVRRGEEPADDDAQSAKSSARPKSTATPAARLRPGKAGRAK